MSKRTPEQITKNMRAVKCKGSKIEVMLMKELWSRGLRYRKNVKTVFGKPDIAFIGKKVAVFVDSEFWHGFDWENRKTEIKSRRDFWIPKIERNIERDNEVNTHLTEAGWTVLRFWGKDIIKEKNTCVSDVISILEGKNEICVGRVFGL